MASAGAWERRTSGPDDAASTVLLIPGGMCTAAFYDDVVAQPALTGAGIRLVATTVPGFGPGRPAGEPAFDSVVRGAAALAAEVGADAVVGHSIGANIALEMAAGGHFGGPVALLEPAFSREDEYAVLGTMDRIGRVPGIGALAWWAAIRTIGIASRGELPPGRRQALGRDMARSDPSFCRAMVHSYLAHLDEHGSLVPRLCRSGATAVAVFCDRSDVGLTDEERAGLQACPTVTLIDVADSGHMVMTDQPARTAQIIVELAAPAHTLRG
jgi:pimeloyl-ACP methyl ester carboxylesterase